MTSQQLFIELMHRLRSYSDTVVLHSLIQQQAHLQELKISLTTFALDVLGGCLNRKSVERSLERLRDAGVLEVRVHANYRTHIKVDADAVRSLLRQPICDFLPGLRDEVFPFLQDIEADALSNYEQDASEVIKKVAQPPSSPDQSDSD